MTVNNLLITANAIFTEQGGCGCTSMIIEVFESSNSETPTEIKVASVDVSRVLPFRDYVAIQITKEKLKSLLGEIQPFEDINLEEPESYFAQEVSVWLDDNIGSESATLIDDIPHHIGLRLVLESILQKYSTSDDLQILIS